MTVAELLAMLEGQDPAAEVRIEGCTQCYNDVKSVEPWTDPDTGKPKVFIDAVLG